jgi:diguanylate cyclase (GGDEF)-like protein
MAVSGVSIHGQSVWLGLLAVLLYAFGAWATSRFFERMTHVDGMLRYAWLFLTALVSGVTIWGTHFVAMLGYHPDVIAGYGWLLTAGSLVIAFAGSGVGFLVAACTTRRPYACGAVGGALVGAAIVAMHYVGMQAMRMPGTMSWDPVRVALSVLLGVGLGALALSVARSRLAYGVDLMWLLLTTAVLLLHFTGISALHLHTMAADATSMAPMPGMAAPRGDMGSGAVLAGAVACMSFLTLGVGTVGYLIDQSRAISVARLRQLALYDSLTGLPNRTSLGRRITHEIARSGLSGDPFMLVVIDVDNFKEINDVYGHPVGDEVLRELGARMATLADEVEDAFFARIGGDEFVALCAVEGREQMRSCLETLDRRLTVPFRIDQDTLAPRVSIGAALFPGDATTAEALVNNADLAMYRAKGDPLVGICVYDADLDGRTRLRRSLAADLREAMDRGELTLHYQVQTDLASGEAIGYEALLRWNHPQLGPVSPGVFIPLAEESGLIVPIGAWVLGEACADAARWDPPLRVSVNVSAVQIAEPGLVRTVREVLERTGLPAHRLELEMTETAVVTSPERALRTLRTIKELGVGLAIDDFGVGQSSLSALRSFPFERIKIDRSFFSANGTPEQTVELVQTVLSLGRTFSMSVLAEGIETEAQLALLTDAGCPEAQGYLFGRPAPLSELVDSGRLALRPSITPPVPRTHEGRVEEPPGLAMPSV